MPERRRPVPGKKLIYPRMGEIWYCQLPEVGGSVQHGHRPVLVVSNDMNNKHSSVVNVVPLTSKNKREGFPVHVHINEPESCGLLCSSTILTEQIMTVPKEFLCDKVGEISDQIMQKVGDAIRIQLPFAKT